MANSLLQPTGEMRKIWSEFWKLGEAHTNVPGIRARVTLTQPGLPNRRQFVVETGSGQHFLVEERKPVEVPSV